MPVKKVSNFQLKIAAAAVPAPPLTLDALLTRYARDFLPLKALATQQQQRTVFQVIRGDLGALLLTDLTIDVLKQWRDDLLARGYRSGTARRYLYLLSGPLTAAVQEYQVLSENPLRKVRLPPADPGRVRFLTDEERERLLLSCQKSRNPCLYPLVLLALSTGARKEELRTLRWRQVDLERGLITLERTKNGQPRMLHLSGLALQVLRGWRLQDRAPDRVLFPSKNLHLKQATAIWRAYEGAARRAGLQDFHFHDLRHTAASYLAMSGASLLEIADILGHRQIAMTQKYAHLLQHHKKGVVERMTEQFGLGEQGEA